MFFCSVFKGAVRDASLPISCEEWRLRVGSYAGYTHPRQDAKAAERRMRQLCTQVGGS